MPTWTQNRYWCTNLAGQCAHALADTPFSQAQFNAGGGRCGGASVSNAQGCGQPLVAGAALDRRPRWAAAGLGVLAALSVCGWVLRTVVFPAPLEQVSFAQAETRTDDDHGSLAIEVVRVAALDRRLEVLCQSVDGTAKAGQDFEQVSNRLVFEPGERSKAVAITLLPDRSLQKADRHFTVTLTNVRGEPRHAVLISPKAIDRSAQLQAEQVVMAASRTAADIAGFAVKRQVIDGLMGSSRGDASAFRAYKQQLADVDSNLVRAREGYAQSLRELQTHQSTLVLTTMDRLADELARKSFMQQSRAMGVMKQQFTELLQHQTMDLDRWVQDLGKVVPRVPGLTTPGSPST
jgi:hypothetical protein